MARYLLCSPPLRGHVGPIMAIGRDMVERGHQVVMLTGVGFADSVVKAGLQFEPLCAEADFDERDPETFTPDLDRYRGLALSRYQVRQTFVRPITGQARSVESLLGKREFAAVLADGTFAGVLPLLARPRSRRPAVIGLGTMPLAQTSVDVPPFNSGLPPGRGPVMRVRNRVANLAARHVIFRSTQRLARDLVVAEGGELDGFILDLSAAFDHFLQLGPAEFEYPRSDLSPNTTFAGPVVGHHGQSQVPPAWWRDVETDGRPVIHLTQGTLDNHDFSQMVTPALEALATAAVRVIVSTGGAPVSRLGALPDNALAVEFIDHDLLMPRTAVMVTNGGYGGVMTALRHGVPVVVAPGGEDKPEVAARVAHFGVGVNLKTRRPSVELLADAVRVASSDPAIGRATRAMATAISAYRPLDTIAGVLTH